MKKNKQIIIEVFNENYLKHKFKLPYRKDLLVGVSDVRVDIKVGEKILQDILPNEFEIDLPLNEPLKISIKPQQDITPQQPKKTAKSTFPPPKIL